MYKINLKNTYKLAFGVLMTIAILTMLLNLFDPDKISLMAFLIVFFFIYAFIFLCFLFFFNLICLILKYFYNYNKDVMTYKNVFFVFSISFLPVYLIGNRTIGKINLYEIILVISTIILLNFYLKKH